MPETNLDFWMNALALSFAAIFFVVGCARIVEFRAAGLRGVWLRVLIPLHVVGCAAFTAAMALVALDPLGKHKIWMRWSFVAAVLILFPIHIYVALKRRIALSR